MAKLKTYDEDFKKQTVKYIMEEAKPVAQVARELKNKCKYYSWLDKKIQPRAGNKKSTNLPF